MAEPRDEDDADAAPAPAAAAAVPAGLDARAVRSLLAKLDMPAAPADEGLDPNRLLALTQMLLDFVLPVYQLTWTTWRTVAPASQLRRTGNLQRAIATMLAGDESCGSGVIAELHRLRQLTASLVSAVGHLGQQLTSGYLSRFQPGEVAQVVTSEGGGGLFHSQASRCWKKYVELSEMLEAAAVEAEVRRVIAAHVEGLMKETSARETRGAV